MVYFNETSCLALAEQDEALEAENNRLRQFVKDVSDDMECLDTCDSYGHDDLCPVVNPVEAWRQLRQEKAELVEALENVKYEAGSHTVAVGQTTGFAKIFDISKAALDRIKARATLNKLEE